jgi:hypothetical protein
MGDYLLLCVLFATMFICYYVLFFRTPISSYVVFMFMSLAIYVMNSYLISMSCMCC